ncbi:MAG: FAD/NAD(P)-binding protein [Chitinophagaceae bacterium]
MAILKKDSRIGLIGGGPSALFIYKTLLDSGKSGFTIDIFERKEKPGPGMPYSPEGAGREHITNVSGNEIPQLVTGTMEWMKTLPAEKLAEHGIDLNTFSDYQVFPRLLFGEYLQRQFELLLERGRKLKITTNLHTATTVIDIVDEPASGTVCVVTDKGKHVFDHVIICSGHNWPTKKEGTIPGYYDSPYPPSKLCHQFNHAVAIKGGSLTAIDAIRTIARANGSFIELTGSEQTLNGSIPSRVNKISEPIYGSNRKLNESITSRTNKLFEQVNASDQTINRPFPHHTEKNNEPDKKKIRYIPNPESPAFRIVMHSIGGLLPAIRFHLENSHLASNALLDEKEILAHLVDNDGFLSLDYIFEKDFKETLKKKDPVFYKKIKELSVEEFVKMMMDKREKKDGFELFREEYLEAEQSIRNEESIHWKEMLAVLSFAMNYPAKHFSAEDMQRLKKTLMPLISIVIAFVPQSSCEELLALHDAGRLELIPVTDESEVIALPEGGVIYKYEEGEEKREIKYKTFINGIGQLPLMIDDFPFESLVKNGTVSQALLKFRDPEKGKKAREKDPDKIVQRDNAIYLKVPGVAITDTFKVVGREGYHNPRIRLMAVPYIGGYNPDYSGLDFCEEAAKHIINDLLGLK